MARGPRRALVETLLSNPRLPAYIANLDSRTLARLVDEVGKEDAGELMALVTPSQMRELVETDLWQLNEAREEVFDPERLFEWVAIWREQGGSFMAEKLAGLGEEIVSRALVPYIVVVDMEEIGIAGAFESYGHHAVMPQSEDNWPEVQDLLVELWSGEPEFAERVLARLCAHRSIGVDGISLTNDDDLLDRDVSWTRQDERQRKGYVTPLDSTLFLGTAREASIDDLLIRAVYDDGSRRYLRRLQAEREQPPTDGKDRATTSTDPHLETRGDEVPARDEVWDELDSLLESRHILVRAPVQARLAGPAGPTQNRLRKLLAALASDSPLVCQARLDEIVYLSNVLVSGTDVQGGRFVEEEAAKAVYATCNLGIDFCLVEEPFDSEDAMVDSFLREEPGLVKAFEIGYHLIGQLPAKAIAALAREVTGPSGRRLLRGHPWVQEQLGRALGQAGLTQGGQLTSIAGLADLFETLALVFDHQDCTRLRILCDPYPCFPRSLEADAAASLRVDTRKRYIEDTSDLRRLLGWLDALVLQ
ncbi:MAG: hypothetical protein KDI19_12775 [Pseudomonadales bacterium]|nr:hypothetical protein [Pseudomonadales bacterium]